MKETKKLLKNKLKNKITHKQNVKGGGISNYYREYKRNKEIKTRKKKMAELKGQPFKTGISFTNPGYINNQNQQYNYYGRNLSPSPQKSLSKPYNIFREQYQPVGTYETPQHFSPEKISSVYHTPPSLIPICSI